MPATKNLFNKIRLKGQKSIREFLLDNELKRIEDLILKEDSMLNHHRNLYVFSAYSGGIRISDLLNMRWKNFTGTHLYFKVKKTNEDICIKLPRKSLVILQFYKMYRKREGAKPNPESFIFPLLKISVDETDKLEHFNAISSATAYANGYSLWILGGLHPQRISTTLAPLHILRRKSDRRKANGIPRINTP